MIKVIKRILIFIKNLFRAIYEVFYIESKYKYFDSI